MIMLCRLQRLHLGSESPCAAALAPVGSIGLLLRRRPTSPPQGSARRRFSAERPWRPLPDAEFGAELTGLDLATACASGGPAEVRPQDAVTLRRVLRERRVVCARGVVLDGAPAFERLCRVFGSQLQPVNANGNAVQLYMVQHRTPGEEKRPSDLWHSDLSYLPRPASATLLYAIELPEPVDGATQGDTLFADMVGAFAALPPETQARLSTMRGVHCRPSDRSKPREEMVTHPLVVRTQSYAASAEEVAEAAEGEASSSLALYLNPAYTVALLDADGAPLAEPEGEALLQSLTEHALHPRFALRYRWSVGDLLVWDNSAVWHRATTLEMAPAAHAQRRAMFRASVLCDSPLR